MIPWYDLTKDNTKKKEGVGEDRSYIDEDEGEEFKLRIRKVRYKEDKDKDLLIFFCKLYIYFYNLNHLNSVNITCVTAKVRYYKVWYIFCSLSAMVSIYAIFLPVRITSNPTYSYSHSYSFSPIFSIFGFESNTSS